MLTCLEIKNYALIENISVEFKPGLNIITGETGAGKSILLGALSLLLGDRASSETVRRGANKSFVEGIFQIKGNEKLKNFLMQNDFDYSDELIVRREISLKGSNRCFINDSPVQLSVIKNIGDLLIDLHGQHDHQSLLKTETHIEFLDQFCNLENEITDYQNSRRQLITVVNEIKNLKLNEKNLKEKLELNTFQLNEISNISPLPDEDNLLEKELNILENSEKLYEESSLIYEMIFEEENNAYDKLVNIRNKFESISKIDESVKNNIEEISTTLELLRDSGDFIRDYRDKIEIDPNTLEETRERAGAIHLLKKKYGGTLENVLKLRERIEKELSIAENFSEKIDELQKKASAIRIKTYNYAMVLSNKRKKKAKLIEKEIEKSLKYLGINESKFKIKFGYEETVPNEYFVEQDGRKLNLFSNGIDIVEFYISTNIGEEAKPLAKTASGGEISRIMLAIKSVLANKAKLPILVFDEIDTGISGRIAQKVGNALKELAKKYQIISITHLPQIAACADSHYSVQKETNSNRVISKIRLLDNEEKIVEIAKLMSGEQITESNLEAAKNLMGVF